MSETDWTRDKFGDHIESTKRYFEKREDLQNFQPLENELVHGYTQRIAQMIKRWEDINTGAHIYGRKIWFTHKNPSNCWLCDGITMLWSIYETYNAQLQIIPKNAYFHYEINGSIKKLTVQTPKKG